MWSYKKWAVAETMFSRNHDILLFYAKDVEQCAFNILFQSRAASTLKRFGNKKIVSGHDDTGKRIPSQTTEEDSAGVKMSDVWEIPILAPVSKERLGYPTQKPMALLERVVAASSNSGDTVLDPFCGCGTAVHAAQKLGRRWIGIDITHLAISLIEKRLRDAFPYLRPPTVPGIKMVAEPPPQDYLARFEVHGTPKDIESARDLATRDKYQFQWWACSLVNAQPFQGKKKGADGGIDGLIFFQDEKAGAKKIVVSVKGGDNVNVAMMRDFAHVIDREKASVGLFVTLTEPSKPMMKEAISLGFYDSPFGRKYQKLQILTIKNLLNGTQRAEYPDLAMGGHTFKKAKIERGSGEQKGRFLDFFKLRHYPTQNSIATAAAMLLE